MGRKTALRMVLSLLRRSPEEVERFASSLTSLKSQVHYCRVCHNISDEEVCPICRAHNREQGLVCVVESIRDIMSLENTGQYTGLYHVLGGVISPMDGVGPQDIEIESLIQRVAQGHVQEVILALPTTMEGDTTSFYLYRRLTQVAPNVIVSQIARGVAVGNELEYTDEITLGRSILNRTQYHGK